ncbi:MAG: hypothetical protein JO356_18690 [Acidobacteria bacterium]|nr:hypothetical protein [Acidobacteriota bacterium]
MTDFDTAPVNLEAKISNIPCGPFFHLLLTQTANSTRSSIRELYSGAQADDVGTPRASLQLSQGERIIGKE